jgi:hypothetical protein
MKAFLLAQNDIQRDEQTVLSLKKYSLMSGQVQCVKKILVSKHLLALFLMVGHQI